MSLNYPALLICVALYVLTIGILPVGRWLLEGSFYNVAWSSKYGDIALIGCVFIALRILQRQPNDCVPAWLTNSTYHAIALAICLGVGVVAELGTRANPSLRMGCEIMDVYHNLFIVPLFVYLILAIALPVTYLYGTGLEKTASLSLLIVWAILMAYDLKTGRLNQGEWLTKNGALL